MPHGIEAMVCTEIAARQARGMAKYGTSVADNPLTLRQWLQHALEECLDQAVYLRRAIAELDAQAVPYIGPDRRKAAEPAATVNDPLTVADAGGWIKWDGVACPVAPEALVDARFDDGEELEAVPACSIIWQRCGEPCDIIAYRLSKEASHG